MSPETTDWHYNRHHKGYVAALNTIEAGWQRPIRGANGNYSEIGELKRRRNWNHAGRFGCMIFIGKFWAATAIPRRVPKS